MHVERKGKCLIIKIFIFSILIVSPRAVDGIVHLFLLENIFFDFNFNLMTEMSSYKKIKI